MDLILPTHVIQQLSFDDFTDVLTVRVRQKQHCGWHLATAPITRRHAEVPQIGQSFEHMIRRGPCPPLPAATAAGQGAPPWEMASLGSLRDRGTVCTYLRQRQDSKHS